MQENKTTLAESPTKHSVLPDSGTALYHPLSSDKQFNKGSLSTINKLDATVLSEKENIPQTENDPEVHQGTKRASDDEGKKDDSPSSSSKKRLNSLMIF